MAFARFMASFSGRALRVVVGLLLIWWGLGMASAAGTIIAIIGVIAALAGLFNFCIVAPFFGAPFSGKNISQATSQG